MSLFCWTPAIETGNALLDDDHQVMIKHLNLVLDAIANRSPNQLISTRLSALEAYAREHFAREDAEMIRIAYQAMVHHQEEHAKLLSQISALQVDLDSEVHLSAMTTYHYLTRWIKDHIVNVDMKLALILRERTIEPQVI